MKKYQVFVSYKAEDLSIAEQFYQELINQQITIWFDKDNLYKEISREYIITIHQAIQNSELLLLLYSDKVNNSDFIIEEEVKYAIDHGIPVFCFPLDKSEMSPRLKSLLNNKQWMYNFEDVERIGAIKESIYDEERRKFLQSLINDKIQPQGSGIYSDVNLFLMRIAIQRHLGMPTPFGLYRKLEQSGDIYADSEISMFVVPQALIWPIPIKQRKRLLDLGVVRESEKKNDTELITEKYSSEKLIRQLKAFICENYPEIVDVDQYLNQVAEATAEAFIRGKEAGMKLFNGAMLGIYDIRLDRTPNEERHLLYIDFYVSDYFTFKFTVELYHQLRTRANRFNIEKIEQINQYAPFLCSLGMGGYIVLEHNEENYLMWTKRDATMSSGDMWHFSFDETVNLSKDVLRDGKGNILFFDGKMKINPYTNFYRGIWEELGMAKVDLDEGGIFEIGIIMSERLEIELLSYAKKKLRGDISIEEQMCKYTENAPDGKYEITKIQYVELSKCRDEFIGRLVTPEAYALFQRMFQRLSKGGIQSKMIAGTAVIEPGCLLGNNVLIEDFTRLLSGCVVGDNCKIHRHVFIDNDVKIGNWVKIQNNNDIYHGVTIEDGVFIGPNVTFTNDKHPRSITSDGKLKSLSDWEVAQTEVGYGASLGGGSVIVCGVKIGRWAMVGAGAVVVKDVPSYALVYGNPAVIKGWVSESGLRMQFVKFEQDYALMYCEKEQKEYRIPYADYVKLDGYFQ